LTQCTFCNHPDREEYERKIVTKKLSMSAVAVKLNCNKSSVSRHMRNCFQKKVAQWVKPEAEKEETLNVINELVRSHKELLSLYQAARQDRDIDAAIRALAEERKHLELTAKLTGQLNEAPQVNFLLNPEFVRLKQILIETLEPFPDARLKLSERLTEIANDGDGD